jgi:hypothetical protein
MCAAVADADGIAACNGNIPTNGKQGPRGVHTIVAKGVASLIKAKTSFTRT